MQEYIDIELEVIINIDLFLSFLIELKYFQFICKLNIIDLILNSRIY